MIWKYFPPFLGCDSTCVIKENIRKIWLICVTLPKKEKNEQGYLKWWVKRHNSFQRWRHVGYLYLKLYEFPGYNQQETLNQQKLVFIFHWNQQNHVFQMCKKSHQWAVARPMLNTGPLTEVGQPKRVGFKLFGTTPVHTPTIEVPWEIFPIETLEPPKIPWTCLRLAIFGWTQAQRVCRVYGKCIKKKKNNCEIHQ